MKTLANEIHITYDTFGDRQRPAILLIAGNGAQLNFWDAAFCEALAKGGLYIIRCGNRDAWLSTKFNAVGVPDITATYQTLADMADDAVGLLDTLRISKAHICGASMGGMIAQTIAFRHPQRVLSLISIMSGTDAPEMIARLATITAPALIIHGSADPLIPLAAGEDTARAIPGARLMMIDGMGHDMPQSVWPEILAAISGHVHAEKPRMSRATLVWRLFVAGATADVIAFALLFLSAGTFDFWQAWVYLGLFTAYMVVGTAWWLRIDPDFLQRRLAYGPRSEKTPYEKLLAGLLLGYLCLWLTIPGFDHRFGCSHVPLWGVLAGFALSILGLALVVHTANYNRYMAAAITVEKDQPVISTGPYAWIRHPMYLGTLVWIFFTSPALGSWWGMLAMLPLLVILVFRIFDEERYLRENLPGYTAYCAKVRWRLAPFVF